MKTKFILLLAMLFLAHCSFAQGDFAPIGAKWYYGSSYGEDAMYGYRVVESEKDTLVNGQICRKLKSEHVVKAYTDPISLTDTTKGFGYYYSNADTVFYFNAAFNKFLPLYIFNVSVGDTIIFHIPFTEILTSYPDSIFKSVVRNVGTTLINGLSLKTVRTEPIDGDFEYFEYTQGIGAAEGHWHRVSGGFGYISKLRCYADDSITYHSDVNIACDYIEGANSIDDKNRNVLNISVYPNPAQDYISIKADGINLKDAAIHIYDVVGKKVNASIANGQIDVSALAQGVYLIKIAVGDDYVVKKIVKQ